jgi:hypothetical protein
MKNNNNIYKDIYYDDGIGITGITRNIIHDSRPAGVGKTHRIIEEIIKNKNKNHIVIAPRHDLLNEYCNAFDAAGVEYVKLQGFAKSCTIMLDEKDPAYKDVNYMYNIKKAMPYTICLSVNCEHQQECQYKKQWGELRDDNNNICKTVLMPADLLPVVDFSEFSGQVFIDENNEKPFPFIFDEEFVLGQLAKLEKYHPKKIKHTNMGYLSEQEFIDLKDAIKTHDVPELNRLKLVLESSIYLYNIYVVEKLSRVSVRKVCNSLCMLRPSEIITCLDFNNREKKHTINDKKWNWECRVEGAIRDLSTIDAQINPISKKQTIDLEDGEFIENAFFIKKLKNDKIKIVEDLLSFGNGLGLDSPNVDFSKEYDWKEINLYEFVGRMKKYALPVDDDYGCIEKKIPFAEYLMYKHLSSFCDLNFSDTTFRYRTEFYIKDILKFKQFFPEYKVKCEMILQDIHTDSVIWLPANTNRRFTHSTMKKDLKFCKKQIQNKISYLKKQGKNPCILTMMDNIKDDGTLCGVPAYHYGSAGGINRYQEHDVLFVVGTYLPPDSFFENIWNRYFAAERGKMPTFRWIPDEQNRTIYPSDQTLKMIYVSLWFPDKTYNAVHRVRPVRHAVDIYWYGYNAPEILQSEMTVRHF